MVYEINKSRDLKERTGNHIWKKVFESTLMTENILIYAHHISLKKILGIFAVSLNPIIIQNWIKRNASKVPNNLLKSNCEFEGLGKFVVINFSHFRLLLWSGIQRILTGSKISTSSTKFGVNRANGKKTRWPPRHLTDCDFIDFSSETTEWNSTKLERKQDLNVLYQVCGFLADRKYKMATPASDWLRHFRLLLCDRYFEFNETWKEARSKRPLPRLCFSGRWEKQDGHPASDWLRHSRLLPLKPMNGIKQNSQEARSQRLLSRLCFSGRSEEQDSRPGLWLAEAFSISPLKPLNWIQQNLTGRKISMSSNKFAFFG